MKPFLDESGYLQIHTKISLTKMFYDYVTLFHTQIHLVKNLKKLNKILNETKLKSRFSVRSLGQLKENIKNIKGKRGYILATADFEKMFEKTFSRPEKSSSSLKLSRKKSLPIERRNNDGQ